MSTIQAPGRPATDAVASPPSAQPEQAAATTMTWSEPEDGLWAAREHTPLGDVYAGFVERVGAAFVAVDGVGNGLGAFATRELAQDAVRDRNERDLATSVWMRQP